MIYFTSDLHFCHNREFLYKTRGFENVYDMNETIVKNWNSVVGPEDDVYVLGDLMLNNNEEGIRLIKQLKGNIHIILGNHDTEERARLYQTCWNIKSIQYALMFSYCGYHFYLSHYPSFTAHIDDRPPKKERLNLFGHTHQKTNFFCFVETEIENVFMYHVGLDSHNMTPVPIETVIADIHQKYKESHPNYPIPELVVPNAPKILNEDDVQRKERKKKEQEEYQFAAYVAKEVVTEQLIETILSEQPELDDTSFRAVIKLVAPKVYQKIAFICPDEMSYMGDYAGKAIQQQVSRILRARFME